MAVNVSNFIKWVRYSVLIILCLYLIKYLITSWHEFWRLVRKNLPNIIIISWVIVFSWWFFLLISGQYLVEIDTE